MAQLISVRLQRNDASPWGFRLQGGVDFAAPLVIQKVNGGSIAERAGLQAGDAVLRVNSSEVFNLRHKEAQDVIIRAGPSFEMTIQRGSSTWKPTVTPVGPMSTQNANLNNVSPVTKTSLAANKPVSAPIGSGHNVSAKPFLNGSSDVRLVNKQYNSPVGLYSEQSIAETLSAQTEVLSTGALGVNFKKNEKTYNPVNSEVLKMVQEAEKEPRDSEPAYVSESEPAAAPTSAPVNASGLRHVTAPVFSPPAPSPAGPTKPLAPGQNICADCERLIVGVFVRIKDKNLHVECFKCATCGASLKNVGYYNINNKLYCDVHAKLAARNNPPAPNLVPVTIPPGSKLPSGTISQALQSHSLPSPSPLSPSVLPAAAPSAPSTFSPASMDCAKNNNNSVAINDYPALSLNNVVLFANALDKMESRNNRKNSNLEIVHNGSDGNDNNDTKKIFTSETTISVNNNNNNNNNNNSFGEKDLNRFEKVISLNNTGVQPGSNVFSGPRPFSNAAAPMPSMSSVCAPATNNYSSTLPRAAGTTQPVHVRGHSDELVRNAPVGETNNRGTIDFKNHLRIINDALANNGFRVNCPPKNGSNAVTTDQYSRNDDDDTSTVQTTAPTKTKTISSFVRRTNDRNVENGADADSRFERTLINGSNNGDYKSDACVDNVNGRSVTHEIDNVSEVVPSTWKSNSTIATLELVDGAYPVCVQCKEKIKRGPFISALGKIWCPEHFVCATPQCRRPLQDLGFVEEQGLLYCETCFEQYLAPTCCQCRNKIKGDCLKAIGKHYHPECFNCFYCGKAFGNNPFFLEDAQPYCEADWNELFTTKCFACGFPVEAGDRWVEALNNNYHSQCFNCAMCKKNLEGQSFYAKGGRPFCKNHAR